ncbi:MAG: hypothetical protein KF708_13675 [Pirellulales bacterium]|nr:hypothetical protein [Pirellulales bacterium]
MKLRGLLGIFAVVLVAGTAQGAGLVSIDSFDVNQFDQAFGPASSSSSSASGSGILGGTREVTAATTAGLPFQRLQAESNLGNASFFSHSQDSTIIGSTTITYDGGGVGFNPTGLGGVDITNGGLLDQIGIRVSVNDLPVDIKLTAYTDGANFSEYTLSLPGGIFSDTDFFVNLASFTTAGGSGADFTNLGALQLFIDGQLPGTDLIFDFLANGQTVPEPVSVLGWAVCMLTAGVFVYRRKGLARA